MRKFRKSILFAAAAVVFFPALLFVLLWWDSRLKPDAKISIGYLKTVAQGGSNAVIFVVTNQSDFPVSYRILFATLTNTGWRLHYPRQAFSTIWPRGTNSSMSAALISVAPYSTNRWRIEIIGEDATPDVMADTRDWLAWRLRDVDLGAWQIQGHRARVITNGPEMNGDYPAPPAR